MNNSNNLSNEDRARGGRNSSGSQNIGNKDKQQNRTSSGTTGGSQRSGNQNS